MIKVLERVQKSSESARVLNKSLCLSILKYDAFKAQQDEPSDYNNFEQANDDPGEEIGEDDYRFGYENGYDCLINMARIRNPIYYE